MPWYTQGSVGLATTFEKVMEAPSVLIAVMVLNMASKKSARRSPGCFGGVAAAQIAGEEGFEGEERWGVAMMTVREEWRAMT